MYSQWQAKQRACIICQGILIMEEFIELDPDQKEALSQTAKIGKIYGIVLLASVAITIGINILSIFMNGSAIYGIFSSFIGMAVTVALGLYLVYFAKHANEYVHNNSSISLDKTFNFLKRFFTLRGVVYLAIIGLTFLGFFVALLFGASSSF